MEYTSMYLNMVLLFNNKNKVSFLVNSNIYKFYGNDKLIRHETEIKQNNAI